MRQGAPSVQNRKSETLTASRARHFQTWPPFLTTGRRPESFVMISLTVPLLLCGQHCGLQRLAIASSQLIAAAGRMQLPIRPYTRTYCSVAGWTCADVPCQNGGRCTDVTTQSISHAARRFSCECPAPFAGHRCQLYRRCFVNTRLCFQTDYERLGYLDATEHCLRQGNFTKPVIVDRFEAFSLRNFIESDPLDQLIHDSVWLSAEARGLPDDSTVIWSWMDGVETSRQLESVIRIGDGGREWGSCPTRRECMGQLPPSKFQKTNSM